MSDYLKDFTFALLKRQTLSAIVREKDTDVIKFTLVDGRELIMHHEQDCCESVIVESITGDLADAVGAVILDASESIESERPKELPKPDYEDESCTWTTFRITPAKGTVSIRWHGSSNGYYSESVSFGIVGTSRWE